MEIYKSESFSIKWDEPNELFHYIFNENTSKMAQEEYIDELKVFIDLVKKHKPKKVFGDMLLFDLPIAPETQDWINANLFPVYHEIGFKKIAILLSTEFVASLSIEQTMQEADTFETRYFDDEQAAYDWLLEQ